MKSSVILKKGALAPDGKGSHNYVPTDALKNLLEVDYEGIEVNGVTVKQWTRAIWREGQVVQHNIGQLFYAKCDTKDVPGVGEDWVRIGTGGFRVIEYRSAQDLRTGDLYSRDGSLYLYQNKVEHKLVSIGPRGHEGPPGKDGKNGKNGKDGLSIEFAELAGTNLVFVMSDQNGNNVETKMVDLTAIVDPIAKKYSAVKRSVVKEVMGSLATTMENMLTEKMISLQMPELEDGDIPLRAFRGMWNANTTYQRGDAVRFGTDLIIAARESKAEPPDAILGSDAWETMSYSAGGGDGSGSAVSGGGTSPADLITINNLVARKSIPLFETWPTDTQLLDTGASTSFGAFVYVGFDTLNEIGLYVNPNVGRSNALPVLPPTLV